MSEKRSVALLFFLSDKALYDNIFDTNKQEV